MTESPVRLILDISKSSHSKFETCPDSNPFYTMQLCHSSEAVATDAAFPLKIKIRKTHWFSKDNIKAIK